MSNTSFYNEASQEVWEENYRYRVDENNIEDTRRRWVNAIIDGYRARNVLSEAELRVLELEFKELVKDFNWVPGGRIAANLGIADRSATTMMNCYVIHPADMNAKDVDSIDYIFDSVKYAAKTLKSEGGIGTNFSYLRPNGAYIEGIASRSPGPVKLADLWNVTSKAITEGSDKAIADRRDEEKIKIRKGVTYSTPCS